MVAELREELGQVVRAAWVAWAQQQPAPKLSWLVPWDGLSEPDKEADRCIGAAVAAHLTRALEAGSLEIAVYMGQGATLIRPGA